MRQVRQTITILPTLSHDGPGWRRARQHESDRTDDPAAILSFSDYWNLPDVRGALYALHGRRCVYCGCNLPRNDRGDVEHFRPKSSVKEDKLHGGYWWIAYSFDNYLLSCRPCNSTRKGDSFPLRSRGIRTTYTNRGKLPREARVLLNPAIDPVEDWLRVDWKDLFCPIRPNPHLSGTARKQTLLTLEFFKVNVDTELVKERMLIRDTVVEQLDKGHVLNASRLASRYSQHSLVAKHVLEDLAPEHLPTAAHELEWLLKDLIESLDFTLRLAAAHPDDIQRRAIDELLWSLAFLWRDPPTVAFDSVEKFLTSEGVIERVREKYEQMDPGKAGI